MKQKLEEKGLETGEVINASRKREDGTLLEWRMLFIQQSDEDCPLPFLSNGTRQMMNGSKTCIRTVL
ncbi:VOC family protein [Bacillus sp. OVS6]|nr:VOC family protein [Bacillus sp. OVS6]